MTVYMKGKDNTNRNVLMGSGGSGGFKKTSPQGTGVVDGTTTYKAEELESRVVALA